MSAAVRRVTQIIQSVASSPGGVLASELGSQLCISRQAATRLLGALASAGIVTKDRGSKRYGLTLTLYEWAGEHVRRRLPVKVVRKEISRLAARLHHKVDFVVLDRDSIVLLERTEWDDGFVVTAPLPATNHWSRTATGKAIVAFSPQELRASLLRRRGKDGLSASQARALKAELEKIRSQGYAEAELSPGRLGLGAPILDMSGFAVGAIGIPLVEAEEPSGSSSTFVEPLREAAARCAEELGHRVQVAIA